MTFLVLFFFAAAGTQTLDQVRADRNAEHRAKAAVDYAMVVERAAEAASVAGDEARVAELVREMVAAMELARDSFAAAGKTPSRQPGSFKSAELHTHEILVRLEDLVKARDPDDNGLLKESIIKVQKIHDAWFDGIMGKKK